LLRLAELRSGPPYGGQGFLGSLGLILAFLGINLGSLWLYLGSFWVRFFTIVNNDGHSLGSFFQKIFSGQKPEVRSQNPELGGADAITGIENPLDFSRRAHFKLCITGEFTRRLNKENETISF
jgi:hypothetical protein